MAEERARKAEKARLVEWFHGAALLEVCLFYWQHQLTEKLSDRRSIRARVAAQRCNLEDSDPSDMLATILPRLAREHATRLRADFATVDAMLKTGALENDSSWIDTIGDRGDPPQHIFLQHMGRMVQAYLCQCLDQGCAEALTTALLEKAQRRLYRPSVELLFPLLGKGLEKLPCGLHCSPSKDMPQGSSKTAMLCTPAKATVGTPGSFDRKGIKLVKEHVARGNVAALAKSKDGKDLHEHPVPRCLFAVGSPLGMFLSIRLSQKAQRASRYFRGLDVRWPPSSAGQGWRFFNIFHPDDPIAYRIEPLLNPAYTNMSPRVVPHCGGLRWNHRIATLWSSVATPKSGDEVDAEAPLDEVLVVPTEDPSSFFEDKPVRQSIVTVDRLDYALQTTPFESMNEMLSAIHSHFSYWENEDMLQFVVDQIFEAISAGKEGKDDASKGK
ncbi:Phospholipase DDHD2 [Symbiodinium microadriaticum]|uniref:Phospholipase DDHD2 n=1 Tax=Symbiodinium microadriaticum TaxID=2951 RepID=A0A1Q9CJ99_SYMMI|nr:Phospholipase DDHD2 [Symbiodinium microadriaticum]